jgi:hypothetical protein
VRETDTLGSLSLAEFEAKRRTQEENTLGKNSQVIPVDVDTHATIDLNLKVQKMEEDSARQAARLLSEENSEHQR